MDTAVASPNFSRSNIGVGSPADVTSRIERLPFSSWQVKARLMIGTATFFDAFDALVIAQVLPVLVPIWHLEGAQVGLLISCGYLGQLAGALGFSALAERKGRVPAVIIAIVLFSIMSLACVFAWNFLALLVFRTVQGIGLGAQVPIAAVYISELTKAHGRGRFVLLYELVFSVGVVAAGFVGLWVVPHLGWEYMFVIGALPIFVVYFIRKFLPESPRWLASRGRTADADRSMSMIEAKVELATKQPLPAPLPIAIEPNANTSSRWSEIFRGLYLRRTLIVWLLWFATYLVYYGIGTWMPTLYRTVFKLPLEQALGYGLIGNFFALVGATLCAFTIDLIGRRLLFSIGLLGSGGFLSALALTGAKTPEVVLVLGSGAYFFAAASAIGLYLYTPELYPTRVRALGVGTATAWLRIASMLGPVLIGALVGFGLVPIFTLFGIIALLAGILIAVFAVETKDKVLETLSP
jgi:MFS transporter, putative metabolite:H+ symporter